jgi:hypothetical protein
MLESDVQMLEVDPLFRMASKLLKLPKNLLLTTFKSDIEMGASFYYAKHRNAIEILLDLRALSVLCLIPTQLFIGS